METLDLFLGDSVGLDSIVRQTRWVAKVHLADTALFYSRRPDRYKHPIAFPVFLPTPLRTLCYGAYNVGLIMIA